MTERPATGARGQFHQGQWEPAQRFARSAAGDDDVTYLQVATAAFNMT